MFNSDQTAARKRISLKPGKLGLKLLDRPGQVGILVNDVLSDSQLLGQLEKGSVITSYNGHDCRNVTAKEFSIMCAKTMNLPQRELVFYTTKKNDSKDMSSAQPLSSTGTQQKVSKSNSKQPPPFTEYSKLLSKEKISKELKNAKKVIDNPTSSTTLGQKNDVEGASKMAIASANSQISVSPVLPSNGIPLHAYNNASTTSIGVASNLVQSTTNNLPVQGQTSNISTSSMGVASMNGQTNITQMPVNMPAKNFPTQAAMQESLSRPPSNHFSISDNGNISPVANATQISANSLPAQTPTQGNLSQSPSNHLSIPGHGKPTPMENVTQISAQVPATGLPAHAPAQENRSQPPSNIVSIPGHGNILLMAKAKAPTQGNPSQPPSNIFSIPGHGNISPTPMTANLTQMSTQGPVTSFPAQAPTEGNLSQTPSNNFSIPGHGNMVPTSMGPQATSTPTSMGPYGQATSTPTPAHYFPLQANNVGNPNQGQNSFSVQNYGMMAQQQMYMRQRQMQYMHQMQQQSFMYQHMAQQQQFKKTSMPQKNLNDPLAKTINTTPQDKEQKQPNFQQSSEISAIPEAKQGSKQCSINNYSAIPLTVSFETQRKTSDIAHQEVRDAKCNGSQDVGINLARNDGGGKFDLVHKCDICGNHDGFKGMNMQKCKTCGIYVHEQCYCLHNEYESQKYPDWSCWACASVGKKITVKEKGIETEVTINERPTKCCLCLSSAGKYHAMHPLYDKDGPNGHPVLSKRRNQDHTLAWVHTLCALFIGTNPITSGLVYGCRDDGTFESSSENEYDSQDDVNFDKYFDFTYKKNGEDVLIGSPHHFVITSDSSNTALLKDSRGLECTICKKTGSRRIAVQCKEDKCYTAFHVGCMNWSGGNYKKIIFFPGKDDDLPYASAYCKKHARLNSSLKPSKKKIKGDIDDVVDSKQRAEEKEGIVMNDSFASNIKQIAEEKDNVTKSGNEGKQKGNLVVGNINKKTKSNDKKSTYYEKKRRREESEKNMAKDIHTAIEEAKKQGKDVRQACEKRKRFHQEFGNMSKVEFRDAWKNCERIIVKESQPESIRNSSADIIVNELSKLSQPQSKRNSSGTSKKTKNIHPSQNPWKALFLPYYEEGTIDFDDFCTVEEITESDVEKDIEELM
mmetsp:Transcript_25994/g.30188  ORF Transcript_25994/g.30188 Transcript_25994/m.30188 type:complete len:1138 (+) Transcript_25994:58-3471(+)